MELPLVLILACLDAVAKSFSLPDNDVQVALSPGQDTASVQAILEEHSAWPAVSQHENDYEIFSHPAYSDYRLRLKSPKICDPDVKQYSGYLDISETRHLFFWFFEARESPEDAPLMMWLNGGPGCSSLTGALFELGPCSIAEEGNSTIYNEYSWNKYANMIFLDQPIGTGFSYASDGSTVDTLADMSVDVYAFLQLFLTRYSEYASAPFHLAAESWGGHYAPTITNLIHKKNKELVYSPRAGLKHINLASVIVANGLTDPAVQFASIPDYACGGAPYPPVEPDSVNCVEMKAAAPVCTNMIGLCYRFTSTLTCNPATYYCWTSLLMAQMGDSGLNPYDLRRECDTSAKVCYPEIDWIERWMNLPEVKEALGVSDAPHEFQSCNMDVNQGFYLQGQAMHNSARLLPELVNDGIRLLAYAGNTDGLCNYMGIERWMEKLEHNFHAEFESSFSTPWKPVESGRVGGEVRSAGYGAGNVTFIQVYDGGHMAPHDQPEVTQDIIRRWLQNGPWI